MRRRSSALAARCGTGPVTPGTSTLAAETAVYRDERVKRAAVVAHSGRRLLVLESYDLAQPGDVEAIRRSVAWAYIDEVRVWPRVPVDNRHNAKIDYTALRWQLESGA